jgi:hypothetical protein
MDRKEQIHFAKARAFAYMDTGPDDDVVVNMWSSFSSDLVKNPLTAEHIGLELGMMSCDIKTPAQLKLFIEGFN